MAKKNKMVSVGLPEIYLKAIEILIKAGLYPNRTFFMNEVLEEFIDEELEFRTSLEEKNLIKTFNLDLITGGI